MANKHTLVFNKLPDSVDYEVVRRKTNVFLGTFHCLDNGTLIFYPSYSEPLTDKELRCIAKELHKLNGTKESNV